MLSQGMLLLGRAVREPAVHTTAAVATLPMAAAGLQATGLSGNLEAAKMATGLLDGNLWWILGMAALFGCMGGVVAELLSLHGNIELPHRKSVPRTRVQRPVRLADPRYEFDLGILSRMVLGAAAGVALLSVYEPKGPIELVVNALVAGSVATSFLRLLQRRLVLKNQAENNEAAAARKSKPAPVAAPEAPKKQLSVVRNGASSAQ